MIVVYLFLLLWGTGYFAVTTTNQPLQIINDFDHSIWIVLAIVLGVATIVELVAHNY